MDARLNNPRYVSGQSKMARAAADFNSEVQKITKDLTETQLVLLHKKVGLEALRRIVIQTPVDTGRARGNWQVSIHAEPESFKASKKDQAGEGTINAGTAEINKVPAFGTVYITNNVPYIEVLEYGLFSPTDPGPSKDPRPGRKGRILVKDGFSVQAPNGMVRKAIIELTQMFK